MKTVGELISNYMITKSDGFDNLKPDISIVLPTYSRAQSGLFRDAVSSLLAQNFKNIELIIIDDHSTDGTEDIIKEFIAKDHRVLSVRYKKNVGQPAISVNLGISLARGQKIICAFDDNFFFADGIETLYNYQIKNPECKICYGKTVYNWANDPNDYFFGTQQILSQNLQECNSIGHSAVLVDRSVHEKIGLYDINIGIVRFWDWDFWIRANLYFEFHMIDCLVNREQGMLQADSLGNTFSYNPVIVQEIIHQYRNDILSLERWTDLSPITQPDNLSFYSRLLLRDIAAKEFKCKFGVPQIKDEDVTKGYILLVGVRTACTELAFDVTGGKLLFVHTNTFWQNMWEFIKGAKAIIFPREVYESVHSLSLQLKEMGIPYYFFTDDDLFCDEYVKTYNPYNGTEKAKDFLRNAKAIIVTTSALVGRMKVFNDNVIDTPLSCTMLEPLAREAGLDISHFKFKDDPALPIRIGYISTHKIEGLISLKSDILKLQSETNRPVELYLWLFDNEISVASKAFGKEKNIKIFVRKFEFSYPKFCLNLRSLKLHFLIHVKSFELAELYPFKTFNYFITAIIANAVPIVQNREPYNKLKESEPTLSDLIQDDAAGITSIMKQIIDDPSMAKHYLVNLTNFIDRVYPIEHNQKFLLKLLNEQAMSFWLNFASDNKEQASVIQHSKVLTPIVNLSEYIFYQKQCLYFLWSAAVKSMRQGRLIQNSILFVKMVLGFVYKFIKRKSARLIGKFR